MSDSRNATHESSTSRNELERLWNAVKHVAGWQWDYEAVPFDEVMSRPRYSHLKCALEAAAAQLFIQSENMCKACGAKEGEPCRGNCERRSASGGIPGAYCDDCPLNRPTQSSTAASSGAYRWIEDAVKVLQTLRRAGGPHDWKLAMERADTLLSGVPCPQEDLGFDSPADRAARSAIGVKLNPLELQNLVDFHDNAGAGAEAQDYFDSARFHAERSKLFKAMLNPTDGGGNNG